jgi:hypothetical protein
VAVRDSIKKRAQPLLEPGEVIEEIFPSRTVEGVTGGMFPKRWIIAVTDRNIVIFAARPLTQTTPRSVAARLPRQTKLGPVASGMFATLTISIESNQLVVQRRFYPDVERADAW